MLLVNNIILLLAKQIEYAFLATSIFLLILSFIVTNTVTPYAFHLLSSYHVGSVLNGLFFLYFFLLLLQGNRFLGSAGIIFFSIVGTASDMFFVLWFIVPALIVFFQIQRKNQEFSVVFKKFFYFTLMGVVAGLLLKNLLTPNTATGYLLALTKTPWIRLKDLCLTLYHLFCAHFILASQAIIFYILVVKNYVRIKNIMPVDKNIARIFLVRFIVISSVCAILNIIFSKLAKLTIDVQSFRYLLNVFWFPLIFFWIVFPQKIAKIKSFSLLCVVFFIIIIVFCIFEKYPTRSTYHGEYVPPVAACVDRSIQAYNALHQDDQVKYGLASYWQARLINQFGQYGLELSAVKPDFQLIYIITSASSFHEKYDFMVLNKKTEGELGNRVRDLYGEPTAEFKCPEDVDILVYLPRTISVLMPKRVKEG
ncbi:MAG: hypothetical protein LRY67_01860 [Gammaproteobacteria bacterium]|nr:hypothetical protein [Gammaproteobacteria bacterium]